MPHMTTHRHRLMLPIEMMGSNPVCFAVDTSTAPFSEQDDRQWLFLKHSL